MIKNTQSFSNVKQDLLMSSLKAFFLKSDNLKIIMPILKGDSEISLRVIDWFVTNYSKKNNIFYTIYKTPHGVKTFESNGNTIYKQFNLVFC